MLERELGAKAELMEGQLGEFSVSVGGKTVAKKGLIFFPPERRILNAVRKALVNPPNAWATIGPGLPDGPHCWLGPTPPRISLRGEGFDHDGGRGGKKPIRCRSFSFRLHRASFILGWYGNS